ncbi:hypothetical protein M8494_12260 [Serratia ureilytica]
MLPDLIRYLADRVKTGYLNEADIDASVERILRLKLRHNLMGHRDHPVPTTLRPQRTSWKNASPIAPLPW